MKTIYMIKYVKNKNRCSEAIKIGNMTVILNKPKISWFFNNLYKNLQLYNE